MHVNDLISLLDEPNQNESWLRSIGVNNVERAATNLLAIARSGMTIDQVADICSQLPEIMQGLSDPDMALNNLEKFVLANRSPLAVGSLLQRDPTALPVLLTIFSTSQYLSDLLIRDTESYDYLRLTEGQLYSREILVEELVDAVSHASEPMQAMQILRRFKHRETLRISFGDLIAGHRVEQVTQQISFVAEAVIEAAIEFAQRRLVKKWGMPESSSGEPCRFVVFALGKLGGCELNYSSDIDLIVLYEVAGQTSIAAKSNQQFFERVTREAVKLLNETTSLGAAYRVDLRLRPEGSKGPVCSNLNSFVRYYELQGRRWERQALIKARPVAGSMDFGNDVLSRLANWIYRPIMNRFDIADIKALKRQIEHRAVISGEEKTNVKTGYGGIRDIEFVIQFLQLLHGGNIQSVRKAGTLDAIQALTDADCLNRQEAGLLRQNYCWLRKLEHRLQIMFDLQTHTLPDKRAEVIKTAMRMGYTEYSGKSILEQFEADLSETTEVNNRILNHLLHDAFDEGETATDPSRNELNAVDLILQQDLAPDEVAEILVPFRFSDPEVSGELLKKLGAESTIFLSSRRCRHFLAAIIVELLEEISRTPDPDSTLVSLSNVVDAIGGKGALWELFSFNPPSLNLFVRLCASSDYLCTIIRRNPGMIDELIDSLLMEKLPAIEWLRFSLDDLSTGAEDVGPIFRSFKNLYHLRVGIRDITGRDDIRDTHRALSDIAEVCIERLAQLEFERCANRYSNLTFNPEQIQDRNSFVILAMGKLGGREPNYQSDLDVVFLYDSSEAANLWLQTSPQHFYCELATRITTAVTRSGPNGKLYELDSRLRPTGKSGALAVSFNEFERYFSSGDGQLWERQALCKARPISGTPEPRERAVELVQETIAATQWNSETAVLIREMRLKMQEGADQANLKRGIGGTVDIEFVIQMLQLKHARNSPEVLVPGTIAAIESVVNIGGLDKKAGAYLIESYHFLRGVEARLRLLNTTARHNLPAGAALEKLAYLLKTESAELEQSVSDYRRKNRERFNQIFSLETEG